jgi:hypothetical protein
MNAERISRGGHPVAGFGLGDDVSYEEAVNAVAPSSNLEQVNAYGQTSDTDLTDAQLSAPMASVLPACKVPDNTKVTIKVAVRHGRAVGVTVETSPHDKAASSCVDRLVRVLRWPSSPKLDTFTTSY